MPAWDGTPAIGIVLARFAELYTRVLRIDIARQAQRAERLSKLITKK
jgi:hypothetical protein